MNKILYHFILILLFCLTQITPTTAQEWSFGGELGATVFSFFQYTPPINQEGGSFDRGYNIPHNEGWILSYYPDNRKSFFTASYTRFHPRLVDALVKFETGPLRYVHIASGTFHHIISLNMGYQFDIGRPLSLSSGRLFFEPLYGVGIEWLRGGRPYPERGVINLENNTRKKGINPSLQTGFRLSYRHRRSKFSVKALGNLGLRYYSEAQYSILLPEEPVLVTFRGKSDFIAAQVSYEYIFKSNKIEKRKKKQKGESDPTDLFSRQKIQELKIGVHPFRFSEEISLSYELFPAKQKQSIFLDVSYFSIKSRIPLNTSKDENNPVYTLAVFKEPYLDIRLGRQLFSEKKTGEKWGVGYYFRSEMRLAKSRKLAEAVEQTYNQKLNDYVSYYVALGASLQYKWLIKDRFIISPILLTDLGVGSNDMLRSKHRALFQPLFLGFQARLYVGYRF